MKKMESIESKTTVHINDLQNLFYVLDRDYKEQSKTIMYTPNGIALNFIKIPKNDGYIVTTEKWVLTTKIEITNIY